MTTIGTAETPHGSALAQVRSYLEGGLLLVCSYIFLDWASYLHPLGPFNITPWNPPPAVAIVWMLLSGPRYAPLVFIAAFVADLIIRGAPGGLWISALTSLVLAGGYTAIAMVLRKMFRPDFRLNDTRRLWLLVFVTVAGTAAISLLYVGALYITGFLTEKSIVDAAMRFWLGDAVGVLVTAPLLLVATDTSARAQLLNSWRSAVTVCQFAVMAIACYLVFNTAVDPSRYFYALFLPLIWIALRGGLPGTVLATAMVQFGVVLGTRIGSGEGPAVVELQALVAAFSMTGLFLGMMVDERERAVRELKRSLPLTAAGEMAGAIAHELNQPLAALSNYASACRMLMERGQDDETRALLVSTIERMRGESLRAGEVVAKLRDFFRGGAMRLEETPAVRLLDSAVRIGQVLDPSGAVSFDIQTHATAETVLIDRLQFELVLRNLLANAFEAVAQLTQGERLVRLSIEAGATTVRIRVADSGPGIPQSLRGHLFEPFKSGKSTGMGLGLSISQSIIVAHGGTLIAVPGTQSEFCIELPVRGNDEHA